MTTKIIHLHSAYTTQQDPHQKKKFFLSQKPSLKLLINRKSKGVLFAEAEKEFIDFLFTLLALPVATVTKLLKDHSLVGCIGNLNDSGESLSDTYIQPGQTKNNLLNPILPPPFQNIPLLLQDSETGKPMKFYTCNGNSGPYGSATDHGYITDVRGLACPCCKRGIIIEKNHVTSSAVSPSSVGGGGLVRGVVTYTVMDDLVVKPMSTISCIALLNRFDVRDVGCLEESVVEIGFNEV